MRPETCVKSAEMTCNDVEGLPVIPIAPQQPNAGGAVAYTPVIPAAATPAAAAQPPATEVSGETLVLLFLLALVVGAGLMIWYRFYYVPKPPTRPPQAEDAGEMTPAPPAKGIKKGVSKKGSKEEKASMMDERDEEVVGSEDEERGNGHGQDGKNGGDGNGKAKPLKKSAVKAAPARASMDDDEMDL